MLDFFEGLTSLISSGGVGAIIGAVAGFFQAREERKNLEIRLNHEQTMKSMNAEHEMRMADAQLESTALDGKNRIASLEAEAFVEGQKSKNKWGDMIKACVRPVILAVLLYQTYLLWGLFGGDSVVSALPQGEKADLLRALVYMILGLTSMGVSWYFTQRTSKKFDKMLDSVYAKHAK